VLEHCRLWQRGGVSSPAPLYLPAAVEPHRLLLALRLGLVAYVAVVAVLAGPVGPQVWAQVGLLAVVAAVASTAWFRQRLGMGAPLAEALVASAAGVAVSAADRLIANAFLPYVLVPCLVAGLRGGLLWAMGTTAVAETVFTTSLFFGPVQAADLPAQGTTVVAWALVAVTVGALGAWIRSLEMRSREREPAYLSAHRLLTELWLVARQLSAGLDPVTLAHTMLDDVREHVPFLRAAVFVRSPGGFLVPIAVDGADRVDWDTATSGESLIGQAWTADDPVHEAGGFDGERELHRAAFPLRMGVRTFGVVALEAVHLADGAALRAAMHGAEESALRLETALLFSDVRSIASSEERRRLAREIHDGIAQELTSMGYLVDDLVDRAAGTDLQGELASLRREVTRLISELRLSIFDLRSDVSTGSGLGAALSDYVQQMGAAARGPTIHLVLDEVPHRLRLDTEVELLRIAQEAITNARKHSEAQNLWVQCTVHPPDAFLRIEDDGLGLGPGRQDSFGLQVMRERAARIGAELQVGAGRHGGTAVTLRLGNPEVPSPTRYDNEVDA
jgi:signal transduction histidine kinase